VHGPPPPLPSLDPPAEVRTADEVLGEAKNDVVRWVDHHQHELEQAGEVARKFKDAAEEWVKGEPERRKYAEELTEATRRPPGAGLPDPDSRETRRRSRIQRHR
jgi:hypothetical protein